MSFLLFSLISAAVATVSHAALSDELIPDYNSVNIQGDTSSGRLGYAVSGGCDVNGDGLSDSLFMSMKTGFTYLVYGNESMANLNVPLSDEEGIHIYYYPNSDTGMWGAESVACVRDMNNDGFDEIVLGYPAVNNNYGIVFVVYGSDTLSSMGLTSMTSSKGFWVRAPTSDVSNWAFGFSVSDAGDWDGDGFNDIVIGAPNWCYNTGAAYVVRGGASATNFDLGISAAGVARITYNGCNAGGYLGWSVSGAGDVNGDGVDDIVLGSPLANSQTGVVYVLYGGPFNSVDLTGYVFDGILLAADSGSGRAGWAVSGVGDVNGDNRADFAIGAPNTNSYSGVVYIVFGSDSLANDNFRNIDSIGVLISGTSDANSLGNQIDIAGDINQDGVNDVLIGTKNADTMYVIFGGIDSSIALDSLNDATGIYITGTSGSNFGFAISRGGDLNGDGVDDIITGLPDIESNVGGGIFLFGCCLGCCASPTGYPTNIPSSAPSERPSGEPSSQPSRQPSSRPTAQPSSQPSSYPTYSDISVFSSSSTFIPEADGTVEYLIVGGGGGGGNGASNYYGGGGGAGGYRTGSVEVSAFTEYTLIVGSGGSYGYSSGARGQNGMDSNFAGITASGGGGGCGGSCNSNGARRGGSGGGGCYNCFSGSSAVTTIPAQGHSGGTYGAGGQGCGGGGSGGGGSSVIAGGIGTEIRLTGAAVVYATGGDGAPGAYSPGIGNGDGGRGGRFFSSEIGTSGAAGVIVLAFHPFNPSSQPSSQPSNQPSSLPSSQPSSQPSGEPSSQPSGQPTSRPTGQPSSQPSGEPSSQPSGQPSAAPSSLPSQPSSQPSGQPTSRPTGQPSSQPSGEPSSQPSAQPSSRPTGQPSSQPSGEPSSQPSGQPSAAPSSLPSQPSSQPSVQPSSRPTAQPSQLPTTVLQTKLTVRSVSVLVGISALQYRENVANYIAFREAIAAIVQNGVRTTDVHIQSVSDSSVTLSRSRKLTSASCDISWNMTYVAAAVDPHVDPETTVSELETRLNNSCQDGTFTALLGSYNAVLSGLVAVPPVFSTTIVDIVKSAPPTGQPTGYPSSFPSGLPSSAPSCGVGSGHDIDGSCLPCRAGHFRDSIAITECLPCPIGTFSAFSGSTRCDTCQPYPASTISTGETACNAVFIDAGFMTQVVFNTVVSIIYFVAVALVDKENRLPMLVISLLPTVDILTDLNYVATTKYANYDLFVWSTVFILLPNVIFLRFLWTARGKKESRALPLMPLKWFPLLSCSNGQFVWLRIHDGVPVWMDGKDVVFFTQHDSIPALLVWILSWVGVFAIQVLFLVIFLLWAILAYLFLCLWLLFGFWCFQNKTFATKRVWNLWFHVWTGSCDMSKGDEIDLGVLNESLFSEFLMETLPQMGLQFLNNQLTGDWSTIGYFSMIFTVSMATNGCYRYLYWILWQGKSLDEVPAVVSLFGLFPIQLGQDAAKTPNATNGDVEDGSAPSSPVREQILRHPQNSNISLDVVDIELSSPSANSLNSPKICVSSSTSACAPLYELLTDPKYSLNPVETKLKLEQLGVYEADGLRGLDLKQITDLATMLKPVPANVLAMWWDMNLEGASGARDDLVVIRSETCAHL